MPDRARDARDEARAARGAIAEVWIREELGLRLHYTAYRAMLRRLTVSGRFIVDPDEPQPIDQQIDNLVAVLLREKPELDRAQAHAALRETVERLLKND